MKKFVLSIIIAAGGLITQNAAAQVGVNVGLRIGPLVINIHKPIAPAVVYDDFYYLPEVDAYYSVPERCYYYMDGGGRWVNAAYLPGRYHNYDWRTARRYELRTQRPYANHEYYRNKYNGNRGNNWGNDQNDQYAYRRPQDRDSRGNDGRLPSSPYDSNNAGDRGGYNNGRGNDHSNWNRSDDNRGNWNNQGRDDNDRNNGRNGSIQPDRSQGGTNQNWNNRQSGSNGNTNWQPNRGNSQPAGQNGDRGNRGNDNRSNMPDRMHFSRNIVESNGRMQVANN